MPHSSGGGSHGGGHHGGSHGRSNVPRISRRHFPGSRRYHYYRNGQERFFYTDNRFKQWSPLRLLFGLFYIPFIYVIFHGFSCTFQFWRNTHSECELVIKDEAGVLSSDREVRESLTAFYKKTGITPAIVTVFDSTWENRYDSLEKYAYKRYLNEFSDEKHWLIVYSVSPVHSYEWAFEGMQGNDTDAILTDTVTTGFNSELSFNLGVRERGVSKGIAEAFDYATSRTKKPNVLNCNSIELFVLVILSVHAYIMLGLNELKYRNAEPCPEDDTDAASSAASFSSTGYGINYDNSPSMQASPMQSEPARMQTFSAGGDFESQVIECRYCGGAYKCNLTHCPHCGVETVYNR